MKTDKKSVFMNESSWMLSVYGNLLCKYATF